MTKTATTSATISQYFPITARSLWRVGHDHIEFEIKRALEWLQADSSYHGGVTRPSRNDRGQGVRRTFTPGRRGRRAGDGVSGPGDRVRDNDSNQFPAIAPEQSARHVTQLRLFPVFSTPLPPPPRARAELTPNLSPLFLSFFLLGRCESRRHAAVLVLKELADNAPSLFYIHAAAFFEHIWVALRNSRPEIRESAAKARAPNGPQSIIIIMPSRPLTVNRETFAYGRHCAPSLRLSRDAKAGAACSGTIRFTKRRGLA